ncbi:hypothetical protein HanIR_Chr09g0408231 [Helianthus annuus]|nr:hypothetical protein HanIR_Chr09g0408231 [Helianthus annuus]
MTTPAPPDSKFPEPRYLTTCEHATSVSDKAGEFIVYKNTAPDVCFALSPVLLSKHRARLGN